MNPDHTKVIATLIICLALIGGVFIYGKKDSIFATKTMAQADVVVDNSAVASMPINDDWKKSLVSISDPIKIVASQSSTTDSGIDNTLTGQISKQFFSLYLADKKAGVPIDQNEALKIANQAITSLGSNFQGKQYGIGDIQITQDTSDSEMASYEQAMIGVVSANSNPLAKDPIDIVNGATQSEDDASLAQLDPIIKSYTNVIAAALKIRVPVKAVGYHVVYLNTLSDILYDLQAMRKILTDPFTGYVGFSNYQRDIVKIGLVVEQMNAAFSK